MSWWQFIKTLSGFADIPFDDCKNYSSQQLISLAEKIVSQLKDESDAKFVKAVKNSLGYEGKKPAATPQCVNLCKLWWPLIVTTNYDSMLVEEYIRGHRTPNEVPISVYGRKSIDCHSLLSSLNSPSGTSYWALQGYFGNNQNGENLEPEIVVGYKQYRKVT